MCNIYPSIKHSLWWVYKKLEVQFLIFYLRAILYHNSFYDSVPAELHASVVVRLINQKTILAINRATPITAMPSNAPFKNFSQLSYCPVSPHAVTIINPPYSKTINAISPSIPSTQFTIPFITSSNASPCFPLSAFGILNGFSFTCESSPNPFGAAANVWAGATDIDATTNVIIQHTHAIIFLVIVLQKINSKIYWWL